MDVDRLHLVLAHGNEGGFAGGGDADLLHWLPFIAPDGDEQVLFAPLRAAEEQHNPPLIKLIRDEQRVSGRQQFSSGNVSRSVTFSLFRGDTSIFDMGDVLFI